MIVICIHNYSAVVNHKTSTLKLSELSTYFFRYLQTIINIVGINKNTFTPITHTITRGHCLPFSTATYFFNLDSQDYFNYILDDF